jgi:hypothetical protein
VAPPDETFIHLFFDCPKTKAVVKNFCTVYMGIGREQDLAMKKFIFTGKLMGIKPQNIFLATVSSVFNYEIWRAKLQKKSPNLNSILNSLVYTVENIRRMSNLMRQDTGMQLNLPLCRNWQDEAAQRRQ